ncbi:sensor histidine kinase [Dyadobacter luticola]|uniref:histidine kinase n=1 Tax=Dyadobacter luticola TaxID=1979387 RepID=A0A5R9L6F5_9BACT|nr:HAMP domain-containing sensor histidine kinase [Dyadobacter luticola]TLV03825.1 HAMP domain-containing histidine kinase [Dyadobacter luticola]
MKLLIRIFRYHIFASIIALVLGASLFYVSVRFLIDREVNQELFSSQAKVSWQLRNIDRLPVYILQLGDSLQLNAVRFPRKPSLTDNTLFDKTTREFQPYRQLTFYEQVEGQWYRVTISKQLIQRRQLLSAVVMTVTFIAALLLILLLLLNNWLSERVWRPFYKTLGSLDAYKLETHEILQFPKEPTIEFDQLNKSVSQLTARLATTYQNLKEFTENAAHEIQTPLAVIMSKIEGLLQDETLREPQIMSLLEVSEAANRLSKLNNVLLLLTKIENHQFLAGNEEINLVTIINRKLRDLEDLIETRRINMQTSLVPTGPVMNAALAEILVNNLLTNAIRHNVDQGTIKISLEPGKLVVSNTGNPIEVAPEQMFERFRKVSTNSSSIGLGLALVKTICQVNEMDLAYTVDSNWHVLTVSWK